MQRKLTLVCAWLAGLVASAAAQAPVAVVEDVKGKVPGVEYMDYVAPGKVIKLGPRDSVVLGYMKSCWRETITGGTVVVGEEASLVHGGNVERGKVECDARMQLTEREASQSAATVVRSMSSAEKAALRSQRTLYGTSPLVQVKERGTLVIERVDEVGERHEVALRGKAFVRGKFYDFAKTRKALTPGGTYVARLGKHKTEFRIDPQAKSGATPVIGRLLRIE